MKSIASHLFRAAFALTTLLLITACSTTDPVTDRFLYLDTADTLQIKFHYSADPQLMMSAPSLAYETEKQRFRDFEEAMEALLPVLELPMEYRVLDEREEPDKGHPVLELYAIRWGTTRFGELEAAVSVRLSSYGESNKLGTIRKTEHIPVSPSSTALDRLYVSTMREVLTEALFKLDTHFELPEEKEGESVFLE